MQATPFKILIAEDDTFCRKGIDTVLREIQLNTEIYQVKNGQEALEFISKNKIDILLTDINMLPINGLELSKYVRKNYPNIKIMVITGFITFEYIKPLTELEIDAIIYKNNGNIADIENALTLVLSGCKFLSINILRFIEQMNNLSENSFFKLTENELKLLNCLSKGLKIQQIADKLFLSKRTTERLLENLRIEFNVSSNPALINKAKDLKLI